MATYFGNNDNGSDWNDFAGSYTWFFVAGYACPGTGAQNVTTLDINIATLETGNIRLAIYTVAGALVAEWDAEYAPAGAGWFAKTAFHDKDGADIVPQLTGGTNYILAASQDGTHEIYLDTAAASSCKIVAADYTGGFPDNIDVSSPGHQREFCIRCAVEAAAGGVALAGSVASVSATSSLLPYITHILIDNKVEAVSSTPTVLPYIYHYLVDNVIAGASSLYGNLTVIVGQVYQMMAGAVNAISSLPSTLPYIYHYLINNVVAGTSSLWGNLTRIVGSVGSNLRIYMKIHRGRF